MITVAIDAEHTRQTAAGTARMLLELVKGLESGDEVRPIVLGGGPVLARDTLRKRIATARQDFLWYPWLGRRRARAVGADVYHCPTPRAPLTRGKPPLVVTVHDLVLTRFPETMTPWSRLYGARTFERVLGAADLVTVPSDDTANDLATLHGFDQSRIRVVPNGVADLFFHEPSLRRRIDEPYILFVGTPEPRKNLPRLVKAMRVLRQRGFAQKLVVAGGGGWGYVDLSPTDAELVGRVSDEELHSLYAHADCLVLPSLHEGFGLPAAEAMAAGAPVVAGRSGALPEVVDGAGVLVDPYDVIAIAEGIEEALGRRDRLIEAGRKRAAEFTWARAAKTMSSVYRELA